MSLRCKNYQLNNLFRNNIILIENRKGNWLPDIIVKIVTYRTGEIRQQHIERRRIETVKV